MIGSLNEQADTPDLACGGLHENATGALSGQPFGKAKWSHQECIDLTAEPGVLTIRDAHFQLKNGVGSIAGTGSGHGSLPSSSGHIYAWGRIKITSGTGRYKGAIGSGVFAAVADLMSNTAHLEIWGSFTMPARHG
jgi:hypothetical protein